MKILKKVKIGGKTYTIHLKDGDKNGNPERANVFFWVQKIWIDKKQKQEGMEESLLHEIIEVIKAENDLKDMSHQTLSTLSQSLYQVFQDNHLF